MKKLILVLATIAITASAFAQIDTTNRKTIPRDTTNNQNLLNNSVDKSYPDGIMLQNGKLMKVKNGQMTTIQENEITLSNGTKIRSDGTYTKKDGTKMTLKEGQSLNMSGKLNEMKSNMEKDMYLVPDSTIKKNK